MVLLLAAWLAVVGCVSGSSAACGRGAGSGRLEPKRAVPGETVRLHGKGFAGDCYDTGQAGKPPPEENVRISLRQGEESWRLATVDAGPAPEYPLYAKLTVPREARPGRSVVEIHTKLSAEPYKVPLRVTRVERSSKTGDGA